MANLRSCQEAVKVFWIVHFKMLPAIFLTCLSHPPLHPQGPSVDDRQPVWQPHGRPRRPTCTAVIENEMACSTAKETKIEATVISVILSSNWDSDSWWFDMIWYGVSVSTSSPDIPIVSASWLQPLHRPKAQWRAAVQDLSAANGLGVPEDHPIENPVVTYPHDVHSSPWDTLWLWLTVCYWKWP